MVRGVFANSDHNFITRWYIGISHKLTLRVGNRREEHVARGGGGLDRVLAKKKRGARVQRYGIEWDDGKEEEKKGKEKKGG